MPRNAIHTSIVRTRARAVGESVVDVRRANEERTMSLNVPLRAEFVSSFVVSAALLCLDVQTELVQRHVVPLFDAFTRAEFDATAVTLTLLFLNLAFVFSPTFVRASKGATNNPTVYVLRMLLGEINATRAILNATASVLAHACSFAVVMWTAKAFPWALPGKAPMVPLTPNGGFKAGALAETAVVAANFIFFGLAERSFSKALLPALGSGFYVFSIVVEGCRYSCGFMNPSVVIASHALAGDLFTRRAAEAVGTYIVGGVAGSVIVVLAAKALIPEPKSVRRARATSAAAVRSISRAKSAIDKRPTMPRSSSKVAKTATKTAI